MRKIVFTILLMISTPSLFALGLGNIELNSALNQSFDARIQLLSPTSSEIDTLSVRLADLQAFNRVGIERTFILTSLQFEIEINDSGPDYIRITSREAIREPYLNFLLEASWSSGRLLREYTVLLDPPLYDPNTRRIAVPSPTVSESEPVHPPTESMRPPSIPNYLSSTAYTGNEYGPTRIDDTLWTIARRVRPDNEISVQQMMLALLRANPEAFIENNINGLREGQVLLIPGRDIITRTSAVVALSQVQSQNSLWEEMRGTFAGNTLQKSTGSTAQPASSVGTFGSGTSDGELRLVSPGADSLGNVQAAASFDSTGQGETDLALANHQLEALSSENGDLRNQLQEAEILIQDLQRLIELRDDELATLQQQAAGGTVEEVAEELIEDADEPVDVEVSEQPVEDSAVETESSPPPAMSSQSEVMPIEIGLIAQIIRFVFSNIMLVGGALGGLIIAIAALLFIKKRKESALNDDLIFEELPDFESTIEKTAMSKESGVESEIDAGDEDEQKISTAIGGDESSQVREEVAEVPVAEPAGEEEAVAAEESEEDLLAEVNVFLAYEHFDQAEEFIRDAIQSDPNNLSFHSKLLEVFYSSGDKVKYEEEARVLNNLTGGEGLHWEIATIMWLEISPNRELFSKPIVEEDEASHEAKGLGIVEIASDQEGDSDADDGLDFDLDSGDRGVTSTEAESDSEQEMLDISSFGSDDVLDLTADLGRGDDEDLLDVTAAASLDDLESSIDSEDEKVLNITGDSQPEEDLLDISPSPNGDEYLLDVTAAVSMDTDMDSILKIPAESNNDNSLDFEIGGDNEPSVEESSDDDVIDFDAATNEISEVDEGPKFSLDIATDDSSSNDGEISLNLGEDARADSDDGGLELSLDDNGGLEISLEDDDYVEEDHTIFITRTEDAWVQTAEDEIATKLDLAKAYVELADGDSALTILNEVLAEGNEEQKRQAEELKAQVS